MKDGQFFCKGSVNIVMCFVVVFVAPRVEKVSKLHFVCLGLR